jgi:hypothetical protein
MNSAKVNSVISRLEGTIVADLKSLIIVADERSTNTALQQKLPGGFNFLLLLSALIACETLGYFIKKDAQEARSDENIRYFLSSSFFPESAFKRVKYIDILVALRTNLAHVFGMTDLKVDGINHEIVLTVGSSSKSEIIAENNLVKINGIKFAELVIEGFNAIKSAILDTETKSSLIKIIESKT